jgi:hypothetical protein
VEPRISVTLSEKAQIHGAVTLSEKARIRGVVTLILFLTRGAAVRKCAVCVQVHHSYWSRGAAVRKCVVCVQVHHSY